MSRREPSRLPLPGEQPIHVYGHKRERRKQKRRYPFLRNFGVPFFLLLIVIFLMWLWFVLKTPVTLVINGQPVEARTHRRTVAGAARAAGVDPAQVVFSEPDLTERIRRNQTITLAFVRPVIVHADGNQLAISTQATDPAVIVQQAGVVLGPNDQVEVLRFAAPTASEVEENPSLLDVPSVPQELRVQRVQPLIINETLPDGSLTRVSVSTAEQTVGAALLDAGYVLYQADEVSMALTSPLTAGLEVTIERSLPVMIAVDGRLFTAHTRAQTVEALLAENGLMPGPDDYTLPALDDPIQAEQTIQLVRVTYERIEEETTIPFDTRYIPDPEMDLDELLEREVGADGIRVTQTRVRYEDGVEVARLPSDQWVSQYPQAQVVAYGTNIELRTELTPEGEITYWRKLRMLATSYSPLTAGEKQPGDAFFGLSATGAEVVRGIVATDPRVVPLGTNVYVPNYGTGVALDIGGAVKGMRIDLGYDDENLVLWNNWTDVYLTPPVPPPDQIVWVLPEIAREVEEPLN